MITPEELAVAKVQLAKHNIDRIAKNLPEDDRELLGHIIHEAGEDFLRIQRQACGDSTFNQ